jgi:predicted nucleic acid-binding protein
LTISERFQGKRSVFIDTAPFIYLIEGVEKYYKIINDFFLLLNSDIIKAYSSVITLTVVLPKPVQMNKIIVVNKFLNFFKDSKNLILININSEIAQNAGRLRGKYSYLYSMDALQISAALNYGTDVFFTNDLKLLKIKEIEVVAMTEFLK